MRKILVLCTGNSCRSQIAEGYLREFAGDKAEVYSAGIETHGVNPRAIAIMKEDGIDISHHTSDNMNEYRDIDFDFVITVCDSAKSVARSSLHQQKNFITIFLTLQKQMEQKKK
jgi:arsenate reductase